MSADQGWTVSFATDAEAVRALRLMRRRWGSQALDHWIVELAKIGMLGVAALATIVGWTTPRDLLAFLLGYFAFSIFQKRVAPRLQTWAMPEEFKLKKGGQVTVSEAGLQTAGQGIDLTLSWRRVPQPRVYDDGLVFRIAPDLAVPFPTSDLKADPNEISSAIKAWKSTDA